MNVNGKVTAVYYVRLIIQLLKKLSVEHADNKIETAVIVGYYRKDSSLLFANAP